VVCVTMTARCRYPKVGDPGANSSTPWPVRSGEGMLSWTPEPQVFPAGTADWLQLPTFLHARYLAPSNAYREEFADAMICEGSDGPTPSPPAPPLKCEGSAYCVRKGVYCGGSRRRQLVNQSLDLAQCEAACTKSAECNCVSWSPDHNGEALCRAYADASQLVKSSGGFSAYLKPSEGAELIIPSSNGICLPVDKSLFQHMMRGVRGWRPFVYEQVIARTSNSCPARTKWCVCTGAGGDNGIDHNEEMTEIYLRFYILAIPLSLQYRQNVES
jgi:hypothetical protein